LVTVPESADVISVLVPAGIVTVPEAAAEVTRVVVPDEEPAIVKPAEPIAGLTSDSPETLVVVEPRVSVLEPRVIVELESLALAIEPASIVLVTVPESPVVISVPLVAGRTIATPVPAVALAARVSDPDVEPFRVMVPDTVGLDSVRPETLVVVEPRVSVLEPRVIVELASLALAIEPASIVLVTVAESPVVISVPVAAGTVIVPDAVAAVTIETVPELEPAMVNPLEPMAGVVKFGEARVRPETDVVVEPRVSVLDPSVMVLFESLEFEIEPASIALVTVPVSPVVITVPVTAGRVIVVVPAIAVATRVVVPEVEPENAAPVPPIVGSDSVRPETLVVVDPRVRVDEPSVMVELASLELAIAAEAEISALTIAPETVCFSQAEPLYT
jgi:hypothetical protein